MTLPSTFPNYASREHAPEKDSQPKRAKAVFRNHLTNRNISPGSLRREEAAARQLSLALSLLHEHWLATLEEFPSQKTIDSEARFIAGRTATFKAKYTITNSGHDPEAIKKAQLRIRKHSRRMAKLHQRQHLETSLVHISNAFWFRAFKLMASALMVASIVSVALYSAISESSLWNQFKSSMLARPFSAPSHPYRPLDTEATTERMPYVTSLHPMTGLNSASLDMVINP